MTRLNHIAIAVPDLEAAAERYSQALAVKPSPPEAQPEHGVRVCFFDLERTRIELLEPLGEDSPISAFLERNPRGGLHHVCLGVEDLGHATEQAESAGVRALGEGPKPGAHGAQVRFLHPADLCGVLVELEQE